MTLTLEERKKICQEEIRKAEIEVGLREKQLNELKPKRQELENESQNDCQVPIQELGTYITTKEETAEIMITSLEESLDQAKAES